MPAEMGFFALFVASCRMIYETQFHSMNEIKIILGQWRALLSTASIFINSGLGKHAHPHTRAQSQQQIAETERERERRDEGE